MAAWSRVLIIWYWIVAPLICSGMIIAWLGGIGSYLRFRNNRTSKLVHLTYAETVSEILKSQSLKTNGCAIFALRESMLRWCETPFERALATLVFPKSRVAAVIAVPDSVRHLFKLIAPLGWYGGLKCFSGNYYAPYRTIYFDGHPALHLNQRRAQMELYWPDAISNILALAIFIIRFTQFFLALGNAVHIVR